MSPGTCSGRPWTFVFHFPFLSSFLLSSAPQSMLAPCMKRLKQLLQHLLWKNVAPVNQFVHLEFQQFSLQALSVIYSIVKQWCKFFIPCSAYFIVMCVYIMQPHGYQEQDNYNSSVSTWVKMLHCPELLRWVIEL